MLMLLQYFLEVNTLFSLNIIHSNHLGNDTSEYLLKDILFLDNAVSGKAAVIGMGLVIGLRMYMYGLAYAGTGNNSVTRKLLQIAVSDVSDDVRRAVVIKDRVDFVRQGFLIA
ncbi:hypothetical protein ABK040_013106 [Willaertia magna]